MNCPLASPCSAALRYHFTASTSSFATPRPLAYITPSSHCPREFPCSADLPEPLHRLGVVPRWQASAVHVCHPKVVLSMAATPRLAAFPEPLRRFGVILRHAPTSLVHAPQTGLSEGVSLIGSLAEPLDRLGEIPPDAPAVLVRYSQVELSEGISLFGGPAVPLDRLGVILDDTPAGLVHPPQLALSEGVSLVGGPRGTTYASA